MRSLSLTTLSLLLVGVMLCGGTAFADNVISVDADGDLGNGVQDTATLSAGTHTVIVALSDFDEGNLAGYTVTLNISDTAVIGNPVTITDNAGFGLATKTDSDASDGTVAIGRAGTAAVPVTVPFALATFEFTVLDDGGTVTVDVAPPSPTITEIGNLVMFSIPIDAVNGAELGGGGPGPGLMFPYWPGFAIAHDIELFNETAFSADAIFLLDGWGGGHRIAPQGTSVPFYNPIYLGSNLGGLDLIYDLEFSNETGFNESAFMLDGYGVVHGDPFTPSNQVIFFDQSGLANVATDFEPYEDAGGDTTGGWVLDEFGNVWAIGTAPGAGAGPIFSASPALPGRTIDPMDTFAQPGGGWRGDAGDLWAVDLWVIGNGTGVVILDSFGQLHTFGAVGSEITSAPALQFGFNIARDLWVSEAGDAAIVLDGYGAIHPLGNVDPGAASALLSQIPYFPGLDIAADLEGYEDASGAPTGINILDGFGAIFSAGNVGFPGEGE